MDGDSECSCGVCESCCRRASLRVAGYVLKKRHLQRKPYHGVEEKERRYVHGQVRMLLAMTGLIPEEKFPTEELRRTEWGKAMRARQK